MQHREFTGYETRITVAIRGAGNINIPGIINDQVINQITDHAIGIRQPVKGGIRDFTILIQDNDLCSGVTGGAIDAAKGQVNPVRRVNNELSVAGPESTGFICMQAGIDFFTGRIQFHK